ncbi:MAG: S8 family serine peptidase [Planctomycetes bacterium]|nr:S8 family serine peptidase [Planctomycetota bacterium]
MNASGRIKTRTLLALTVALSTLLVHAGEAPLAVKPVKSPEQNIYPTVAPRLVQVTEFIRAAQGRTQFNVDGSGLTVAVLDTGLNTTHVDFAGKVIAQRNYTNDNGGSSTNATDGDGHGTNVGGIIVANGTHVGIAPGANIIPIKVLSNNGSGTFAGIEAGVQWVIDNRVQYNITCVNMSLGADSNDTTAPSTSESMRAKIRTLRNAGVAVLIAAGNSYYEYNSQQGMGYPANIPECISVGAVFDSNVGSRSYGGPTAYSTGPGRITPFSQRLHENVSSTVRTDIFAPGAPVTSAGISGPTSSSTQDGTSQATPVTAGVVLLMQQLYLRQNGTLPSVDQIEGWLRSGGVVINDGDDEDDNVTNTGLNFIRVDVVSALSAIGGGSPPPPSAPSITQQPASISVNLGQTATFTVAASGTGLSYQWQENGSNIGGATSASYTTPATTAAYNGRQYRCVVSNANGSATSNAATLTVVDDAPQQLANGVSVSSSVALNAWRHFFIQVPANATSLTVQTTGASADVDLYVRYNAQPTLSSYSFRPYTSSGNESVTVNGSSNPALSGGTWYCSVHGYAAGTFTITATYTAPAANQPPTITSGPGASPNPAQTGQSVAFSVSASDPDGNPLTYSWTFGDGSNGSGANVSHAYASAGAFTATVTISDGTASVNGSVQVTVQAPPPPPPALQELANGVGVNSSVAQGAWKHFFIDVPNGATSLTVRTTNATGDVDLYVRYGSQPSLSSYHFRPYTSSGNETVTVNASSNPSITGGDWYCSVHGYESGSFTITATFVVPVPNEPPFFLSTPTANPNPAQAGQAVNFTALADDPDGDALTYVWSFGENTSANGSSVNHAYAAGGTYTATVTVSDGTASVSASVQVTVQGVPPPTTSPLNLTRMQLALNFRYFGRDTAIVQGYLPALSNRNPTGLQVQLNLGGVVRTFTLDYRGRGFSGYDKFYLYTTRGGYFTLNLRGSFASSWLDEGMVNADCNLTPITMPMSLTVDGVTYSTNRSLRYTARAGRSGKAY